MKNIVFLIMTIGMILFWTGCAKEETNPGGTTSVTVSGTVLDKNGAALNGVSLSLGTASATTDVSGAFSITGNVSGERGMLTASLAGYMKGSYSFVAEANKSYTTKMILGQADANNTFNVSSGGTVTLTSGAQVVIPANAVTLMDGSPYTGTNVTVEVQEINEDLGITFSSMIPGITLSALNSNNEAQELVTYGMMTVELYGDNNEALQLADGQTASLTFAIPAGQQSTAPSTIGLWYFDETAGLWIEEGTAIRQGNQYIGNVSHFTTWNCDQPHPPCTISGCVEDSLGNAQPNLTLQVGQITVQTDTNGCFSASVPAQFLPINISYIDYVQMQSCILYSLSSVISPASNYNVGTVLLCSWSVIIYGSMTDSRDGEVYQTVTIGNQTWMAENLRYNAAGSYLNPANPSTTYGRLYDWSTVMNGATTSSYNPSGVQGICPSGWHLPSDSEWNELEMALGMPAVDTANTGYRGTHGTEMKSTTGWANSGNSTNAMGFNAFPAGNYLQSSFILLGSGTGFWSSTEASSTTAWSRILLALYTGVRRSNGDKPYGVSCRCIKD